MNCSTPKLLSLVFLAGLVSGAASARDRKDIPKAPLPSQILLAKKVFISKGVGATAFTVEGGFDLAFDAFYSDMKAWNRYMLTDKPEDADVVMQPSYTAESTLTGVSGRGGNVSSERILTGNLLLVVYDSQLKTQLWSASVAPGTAFRKKNQEKEMVKAGEKLVSILKERVELSSPKPETPSNSLPVAKP